MIRPSELPQTCTIEPRTGIDVRGNAVLGASKTAKCMFVRRRRQRQDKDGKTISLAGEIQYAPVRTGTGFQILATDGTTITLTTGSTVTISGEKFRLQELNRAADMHDKPLVITAMLAEGVI